MPVTQIWVAVDSSLAVDVENAFDQIINLLPAAS